VTSRAAESSRPLSRASTRAFSSTIFPRAMLTRIAPGFIAAKAALSRRFLVAAVSGAQRKRMSTCGRISESVSGLPRNSTWGGFFTGK
jgi:hypothetical protein